MARAGYCSHGYRWNSLCPHCKFEKEQAEREVERRKNEILTIVMNELRNETDWAKLLALRIKQMQGDGGPRTCNHAFDEVPTRDAMTGFTYKQCRICGVKIDA